jgi:Co/Zn/Cd efflux system component
MTNDLSPTSFALALIAVSCLIFIATGVMMAAGSLARIADSLDDEE